MKRALAIVGGIALGALVAPEVLRAVAVWSGAELEDVLGRAPLVLLRVAVAAVTAGMSWALLEHLLPPRDTDAQRREATLRRRVRRLAIGAVILFALVEAVLAWPPAPESWRAQHARKIDPPCATRQPWPAGELRVALGRGERLLVHVSDMGRAHVGRDGQAIAELADGGTFTAPRSAWYTVAADAGAPLCIELSR